MLDRVWVRYLIIFVLYSVVMAMVPAPIPYLGAAMWIMAALLAWRKPNDRDAVLSRSLLAISGYAGALAMYLLFRRGLDLAGLTRELGVNAAQVDSASAAWGLRVAQGILGLSFLIPLYYGVYWFQMMFWDRLSTFFRPGLSVEEGQARMKRGGRRNG